MAVLDVIIFTEVFLLITGAVSLFLAFHLISLHAVFIDGI